VKEWEKVNKKVGRSVVRCKGGGKRKEGGVKSRRREEGEWDGVRKKGK